MCDEVEQANPDLCPEDGPSVTPPPQTPTPTPTPLAVVEPGEIACTEEDWLLRVNGCADYHGAKNEPNAHIGSSFEVCFTVDAQCTIQGSAQG